MMDILALPFMQRAVIAGVLLALILAVLGIFVVLKRMAFLSDGIAHASLAGVAAGILAGLNPLLVALGLGAVLGALIAWLERRTKLAGDALIGLVFTGGMALGVVLLAFKRGYQPELVSFLFGNILAVQWNELIIMAVLGFAILVFLLLCYKRLVLMLINQDLAHVAGIPIAFYQTLLYVTVAVATVLGIKLLGIVLVSALMIMPVTMAKLLAKSFGQLIVYSVVAAELMVILGLLASVTFDLPAGAVIVLCGLAMFFVILSARALIASKPAKR